MGDKRKMTKEEMKNRISMALKDPMLQQGFEIICKKNAELEKENALVKSLLYGTQRTCDNCGFVNCENFQRQRKSEPCSLYIPYQVRIKNLENESDVLRESYSNSEMNLDYATNQLTYAKEIIRELLSSCFGYNSKTVNYEVKAKAEAFLKGE